MNDLEVDVDALIQHAGRVQLVADAVSRAVSAAWGVDLHDGAFGVLCAFLPPVYNGTETATGEAAAAARDALDATTDGGRAMARSYADVDDGVGGRLSALAGRLP